MLSSYPNFFPSMIANKKKVHAGKIPRMIGHRYVVKLTTIPAWLKKKKKKEEEKTDRDE